MSETLAQLVIQAVPQASTTPPVQCGLTDNVENAISNIVGNIEGLQAIGPWIFGALLAILVLVSVIPKLRRAVIEKALWLFGVLILGSIVFGVVVLFTHPVC